MEIQDFISKFKNHPVLFVGAGLSLRYLENSYNWEDLLKTIARSFHDNDEYFLDLKAEYKTLQGYRYECIASRLEKDFDQHLKENRHGKFEAINNQFYELVDKGISVSRFKLYIADLMKDMKIKESAIAEISEFKKARKNISSVITTNYDHMMEELFGFHPLIGNDILLSNPYGSVYKIHGCVSEPGKIIITENDYEEFDRRYELIRAQLLSMFIHNPIIFIGYNIGDKNIKDILKTIFSYVEYNSDDAQRIRDNFLLVEYDKGSNNTEVLEHDIDIEGFTTIRINKLKTDDYTSIYRALSNLMLPVSAMDIRKVQNVVRDICAGGSIEVSITENLDQLENSDKVLVLGSKKTIQYEYQTTSEMMENYFAIIEESNAQLLMLLNKQKIQSDQYFPIYEFASICPQITRIEELKIQQRSKIDTLIERAPKKCKGTHTTPQHVLDDCQVSTTYKNIEIVCSIMTGAMDLKSVELYLKNYPDKGTTDYRKILCAYDLKKNM